MVGGRRRVAHEAWQAVLGWLRGHRSPEPRDVVPSGLVLGLRDAALGLAAVERETDEAERTRTAEDFTQARLFTATAGLIQRCADWLTDEVAEEGGTMERWRSESAAILYRAVIDFSERAQAAIASPPGEIRPVTTASPLARVGTPRQAGTVELLELSRRLEDEYAVEISLASAGEGGRDRRRLEELLAHLRSRTNLAESLLGRGLAAGSAGPEQSAGRAVFDDVLRTWMLIVQELVQPNVTAGLQTGPGDPATGRYTPDNVWMMTDPVAKARYEREGRLDELEQDIRFSVLRGHPFAPEDIAFAQQIDWLEQSGVVKRMASYWAVSPHSPIYRALEAGQLSLGGRTHAFHKGDEIVWLCQMGMEMVGVDAPVLIGSLRGASVRRLCDEMGNAIMVARAERGRS